VPSSDSGDDFVWVCGPGERLGIIVCLCDTKRSMVAWRLASLAKNPSTASMCAPAALDRTRADTDGFRHHSSSPMGRLGGQIGPGERHNTLGDIRPSCLITQESVVTTCMKRSCHRRNSTISARQTCLCGALRSRATVVRRQRSTGLRVMEIPVRMRQTCMQRAGRESLPGFKCDLIQ
jgi:hypothetical protein